MKYTIDELTAAKRQIDSTLHKLRETVKTFESKDNSERYKSQITLAKRRMPNTRAEKFPPRLLLQPAGGKMAGSGAGQQ